MAVVGNELAEEEANSGSPGDELETSLEGEPVENELEDIEGCF